MQGFRGKDQAMDDSEHGARESATTRRGLLRLGAVGATAIVTIRPALAQTATSVLNCSIPVPDAAGRGKNIAADGSLVRAGTAGSFAPPARPLKGEDVKAALRGRSLPGTDPQASRAYTNYIRRLQHGQSGFTCYASLQTPGR
jgi:hypothetical protein